jgi:hypothetical protein
MYLVPCRSESTPTCGTVWRNLHFRQTENLLNFSIFSFPMISTNVVQFIAVPRMKNVGNVFKKYLSRHPPIVTPSNTLFRRQWLWYLLRNSLVRIHNHRATFFFPSAENVNIPIIFSFDDPCSTEYTFFAYFVTRTRPVDGHIWKTISSPLKIWEGPLVASSSFFSFIFYSFTSSNHFLVSASETQEFAEVTVSLFLSTISECRLKKACNENIILN